MDETALYLEDPGRTTIDITNSKRVLLNTSGFASMRITVVLAVKADGTKIAPLVILKGKPTAIEKRHGIWVVYQTKAWVDCNRSTVTMTYTKRVRRKTGFT